ncbi:triphosphoribosyl-dephospho-CoA synthase, partial [Salmonella enterica subsp. enterica serovar Kentucky]|nr:triphosphoribosyl-dephospho-CoA synthase [Salmonella enterica subsp. enterica serovar Kentucky]
AQKLLWQGGVLVEGGIEAMQSLDDELILRNLSPGGSADLLAVMHVFNDRGVVELPCKVTQRILPGVAAMPQGAWTRLDGNGVDVG